MKLLDFPAEQERDAPRSPEVIFREAKQRRRRRRMAVGSAVLLAVGVIASVASVLTSGTGTPPPLSINAPSAHPAGTSGFRWQRVITTSAPPVRIDAPAAYDQATRQLVLIGGVRQVQPTLASPVETTTILDDTWVFAHNYWSQMTSGPTPPVGTQPDVVAYDPAGKVLILVTAPTFAKGTTRVTQPSTTWAWTGSHWREMFGSGPRWGTTGAVMAYDPTTHQLVFVPNYRPSTVSSTYVLGGSEWLREANPPRLIRMAYDPASRRLLGVNSADGSMWWWTGKRWQLVTHHAVLRLKEGSYKGILVEAANWVTDQSADEIIALGLFDASTPTPVHPANPPDLFTWLRGRWRPIDAPMHPAPTNMQFLSLAYDGSVGGVVGFGGGGGEQIGPRTWVSGGNSTWELVRSR